jgi:CheY-like chemotaxis protein
MDTAAILVVDETPTNLELVGSIVEAEGFRTRILTLDLILFTIGDIADECA